QPFLAPSRRLRTHVPRLQCGDEQTRSNDKPAAQFDPRLPWRRIRESSQKFVRRHLATHRGVATAALGIQGIEHSCVVSSSQMTGEERPDGKQFVEIRLCNSGYGWSPVITRLCGASAVARPCRKRPIGGNFHSDLEPSGESQFTRKISKWIRQTPTSPRKGRTVFRHPRSSAM